MAIIIWRLFCTACSNAALAIRKVSSRWAVLKTTNWTETRSVISPFMTYHYKCRGIWMTPNNNPPFFFRARSMINLHCILACATSLQLWFFPEDDWELDIGEWQPQTLQAFKLCVHSTSPNWSWKPVLSRITLFFARVGQYSNFSRSLACSL